jgi:enoyl-CoA hydratase
MAKAMRSDFETITAERRDNNILLVTLNRPEAANALNTQMGLDLVELFEAFTQRTLTAFAW